MVLLGGTLWLQSRTAPVNQASVFQRASSSSRATTKLTRVKFNSASAASISSPENESASTKPDERFKKQVRPFLENFCLDCHTGEDGESGVDLDQFLKHEDVEKDLEIWLHALEQIEQGSMPPDDSDQPSKRQVKDLTEYVLSTIASRAGEDQPLGRLRRLNRVEYENTIRDLFRLSRNCFNNPARIIQTNDYFKPMTGRMPRYVLAVSHFYNSHRRHSDLPGVSNLPVDPPVEHGFANDQEALSLSPLLLENYFDISTALLNNSEFAEISGLWDSMFIAADGTTRDQQISHAHEQISLFLPRAFRRTTTTKENERYQLLFDSEFADSGNFTEAMKTTVSAILVSPNFLFRREFLPQETESQPDRESELAANFAMANRLSYFLWASMPDDELFQAARERRLTKLASLDRQVDRMLDDERVKSLATDFGMQWLKVQKAASALPDKSKFPEYYQHEQMPPPAVSMMIEQLLFFEAIMVENRSILEFISSDFAFLNRQLMDWYQVNPKTALGYTPKLENFEDFFRIKWSNRHRGGVISSGAMLVSTSTTTRTSPVYRGAWVLDVIFNSPPPPAPADIPPLESADGPDVTKLNVREKLAIHREDAACASCHDRIDPMGFALEMFDGVGRWRLNYETGEPIDLTGSLNGEPFKGSALFKNAILKDKTRFVRAFVEHTLKYALGRQLHYSDEPEIRRMTDEIEKANCRFRSVIKQVVGSELFRR
jgi:mono/diheme cytochrome c family protein